MRVLLMLFLTFATGAAVPASTSGVVGSFSLVVGQPKPDRVEETARLFASGVVIPLSEEAPSGRVKLKLPLDVPPKLKQTLLLKHASIERVKLAAVDGTQPVSLKSNDGGSDVIATATLVGSTAEAATFQVQFRNGSEVLADSRLVVKLGDRAVVGALNASTGTYFFLVVNPQSEGTMPSVEAGGKPFLVNLQMPRYTDRMISEGAGGRVRVRGVVGIDGRPSGFEVLEAPSEDLAQSALAALAGWRYLPGKDADGKDVRVQQTWTVQFVLE